MVANATIERGEVFLVKLNPTRGSEIRKARPCVIVSPDEPNGFLRTFIVAPLTTSSHAHPFRISCRFRGRSGHIVLDQIRTVDQGRLGRRLGCIWSMALERTLPTLREMFAPSAAG